MRLSLGIQCVAALLSVVTGSVAADSSVYKDPETGFTFSQFRAEYQIGKYITYRIAVPASVPENSSYDVVLQVIAPVAVGWAGIAWGGTMVGNPLTVGWANGNSAMVSSRKATGHTTPSAYPSASYTLFKTGTRANSTHWQYTVKCSGCTSWGSTRIPATGTQNKFAWAFCPTKPVSPSNNQSSFSVHESYNYWTHDFSTATNVNFASLVQAGIGKRAVEFGDLEW
ncbi:CBD9-like protein [Tricladium varicosporioides]|nr:CBD9-like protein [Hymenoscyphus varicosporioides]